MIVPRAQFSFCQISLGFGNPFEMIVMDAAVECSPSSNGHLKWHVRPCNRAMTNKKIVSVYAMPSDPGW